MFGTKGISVVGTIYKSTSGGMQRGLEYDPQPLRDEKNAQVFSE